MEMGKTAVPEILLTLVQQLNYEAREKSTVLQVEESSSKIAKMQGFLSGVSSYKSAMFESGYAIDERLLGIQEYKLPYLQAGEFTGGFAKLREIVSDVDDLTESAAYTVLENELQYRVEEKKNELFYSSNKGRDLYFAKGWYDAMSWVGKTIDKLRANLEAKEEEKKEMLPFGDEE